jgi:hypothetical protein
VLQGQDDRRLPDVPPWLDRRVAATREPMPIGIHSLAAYASARGVWRPTIASPNGHEKWQEAGFRAALPLRLARPSAPRSARSER